MPVVILLTLAFGAAAVWLVQETAHPPQAAYLITPENTADSARAAQSLPKKLGRTATASSAWLSCCAVLKTRPP